MALRGRLPVPGGRLGAGAAGIAAAAVAAVLVAEVAVLLLSPGDTGPEPLPVEASDYFSADQIERARDFRGGQRNLMLAGLAVELIALGALALGRPRRGPAPARPARLPAGSRRGGGRRRHLPAARAARAADRPDRPRARRRRRALDPGRRLLARRPRPRRGHRARHRRDRRGRADRAATAPAAPLVAGRRGRRRPLRDRQHLAGPGRARAGLQRLRRPSGRAPAHPRAGARRRGRGRRRPGAQGGRLPPRDQPQRLRRRDRVEQAGRPLRQSASTTPTGPSSRRSSPTSSATSPTTTSAAASSSSSSSPRSAC